MTTHLPLRGLRVLEFSHMVMGPSAGMILADLGATVTKIEPLGGDSTRTLNGSGAGFFPAFNRNKRSLALDLKKPKAVDFVRKLTLRADVVLENFRPGAMDDLGLGAEALTTLNPRLVYCSLKGFLSGPYENRTALDEVVQMMGGLAYMTGPKGRPLRAGASINDVMGGMFGVIAIQAALRERETTGRGGHVKAGLFENNAFLMSQHMMQSAVTGVAAKPMPERVSAWAVYDVFRAQDNASFFLGVVSDTQWGAFCAAFGLGDLLSDPDLHNNAARVAHRTRFMPRLHALFASLPVGSILATSERIGLPFAPINAPDDLNSDPHLLHKGAQVRVTLEDGRAIALPALPIEIDGKRMPLRKDIPATGEDNLMLCEEAGLSEEEVHELVHSGAMNSFLREAAE
jgi:crotonobetainyl-CoA:carnitine CoA-transferase CaiB-like acyl-CoA transferase